MIGQFLVSLLICKPPVDLLRIVIPSLGACFHFVYQSFHISDPPVGALDIHHIDLDFGGIASSSVNTLQNNFFCEC